MVLVAAASLQSTDAWSTAIHRRADVLSTEWGARLQGLPGDRP